MADVCFAAVDRLCAAVLAARPDVFFFCAWVLLALMVPAPVFSALAFRAFVLFAPGCAALAVPAAFFVDRVPGSEEALVADAVLLAVLPGALVVVRVGVFFTVDAAGAALPPAALGRPAAVFSTAAVLFVVPVGAFLAVPVGALSAVPVLDAPARAAVDRLTAELGAAVFFAIRPSVVTPSTLTSGADNKPRAGRTQTRNANACQVFAPRYTEGRPDARPGGLGASVEVGAQSWLPSPAPTCAGSCAPPSRSCSWLSM
ncbi:MAG TPA: hypothetical protein VLI66_04405 [Terrabacter sp.]|nr:hypothetical protein [Terrabacter sp.]